MAAMRKYSAVKVMYIISDIRECDARSKGVGNPSTGSGDLLKELIYKILH
jgi:DNA polymerase-3 subunit delta